MAFTIENNNELFPAVLAGDAAAREAMIVNNVGLVIVKAGSLIRQMPSVAYLRDDLVSAGYIGLVRAVNKVPTGRVRMKALNAWIGRCVTKEMRDLLPRERSIHIPRESSRLARNHNRPIEVPTVFNVIPETLETHSELAVVELRDIFDACCKSETERKCLRLREAGYTFQEIGTRLNISKSLAQKMFRNLQERILACWEAR